MIAKKIPASSNPEHSFLITCARSFLFLVLFQLLLSCSINKKLNKQSVATSSQSDVTTTVTELLDTTITIKSDSIRGSISIQDLFHGKTLYEDNGSQTLELSYDTAAKKIVARATRKAIPVPLQVHRTTTTHAKVNTSTKTSSVAKDTQNSLGFKTINLWIIMIIMVLIFAWYLLILFKKKRPGEQSQP